MSEYRPRRSMLFMPADNERALAKAKSLSCDGVILDLEDAVAPAMKAHARDKAVEAVKSGGYAHRELIVRVNGLDTEWWQDDVRSVAAAKPSAILIPKVDSAETVHTVSELIEETGAKDTAVWAMLETPMAYLRAEEIAASSERLSCFVVGTNDLVKDLRAQHTKTREPVITALGLAVLTARAYGLTILDGVYNDFRNSDGFWDECLQARDMGFDGKTLIHPTQIDGANEAFGPGDDDVVYAEKLIAAFHEAKSEGKGVAVLDGKMIEDLHVEEARRTLAIAAAIACGI
ncbi:MAG: CoA ester lyase [Kordiimonas sp.]